VDRFLVLALLPALVKQAEILLVTIKELEQAAAAV
jgi:hypothetical protein